MAKVVDSVVTREEKITNYGSNIVIGDIIGGRAGAADIFIYGGVEDVVNFAEAAIADLASVDMF